MYVIQDARETFSDRDTFSENLKGEALAFCIWMPVLERMAIAFTMGSTLPTNPP
jgi:hypothetical protein